MTPQDKQNWESNIRNWTVENLKDNDEFMELSKDRDFAVWALSIKPELKRNRPAKMKFLGLKPTVEKEPEKIVPVKIEPVEKVPVAVQRYREVVQYGKDNGFL